VLNDLIAHQVDKIRRLTSVDAARVDVEGLRFGLLGLILADGAGFNH
jgi:hypothetical protein